jgi:hypothetical protein
MSDKKQIYLNPPQQEAIYTGAHTSVFVGGRRIGKTHGIAAPWLLRNLQRMPRSSGGIVVPTYKHGLTNTLPGTLNALESFGYKRNVHFHIGHRPPKSAGFEKPLIEPESYDSVISWYNGSIQYIISQDRKGTSNSLTLDYVDVDEARYIDYNQLKDETFPANGGIKSHFGHIPWHHSLLITSDMPTTKRGSWFLSYKEKTDNEVIETIHGIINEIWKIKTRIATGDSPAYLKNYLNSLYRSLSQLRAVAIYYREWSSIENLLVLGEKYIAQMKRDLPPLIFQTSILCRRIGILKDGFYQSMVESLHYYSSFDNSYLDGLDFNFSKIDKECCLQDKDVNLDDALCIAMDYNSNINWIVTGQERDGEMLTLKSFYVKYERKIREVVQDFCNYYRYHHTRTVVYYYDTTALGSNYAVNDEDFASVVISTFESLDWTILPVNLGNPLPHMEKHLLINRAFKGESGLFPRINKPNNEALVMAMEKTGTRIGTNGFKKDKTGEKLMETEEDKLEYRTDGTDAFDTLCIGMNKFPYRNIYMGMGGGMM